MHYASRATPTPEQVDHWGDDWNGCKLWGACRGEDCSGNGRPWRSPVLMPTGSSKPPGVRAEDRRVDRCPRMAVAPAEWSLVHLWSAWRQVGGMPGPGSMIEQEALLVEAFSVLDAEQELIGLYHAETAERRAKASRGVGRGRS